MPLPLGVSAAAFGAALQEFANAVGGDWVFYQEADVVLYDDAYSPFVAEPEKQIHVAAALAPRTVEEVQQIVRTANKYKIPLYAISTGRNLGYGGTSPVYTGSVIVDLKRMNRVIELNAAEGYAILEPGVSFMDLQRYFDEHDAPFLVSAGMPGWGSPVGNALDHGISAAAGDNFGMVKGIEAVLPNGEIVRSGCGATPNSKLWANYPYGFGPVVTGIFSQSNFGIVTKAVFWLVRKPEAEQGFTVSSYNQDDMQPLIEAGQLLRESGLLYTSGISSPIRESMSWNDGRAPYGPPEVNRLLTRRDGGTVAQWSALAKQHSIPLVAAHGAARGPATVVRAVIEHAQELFGKIPGTTFQLTPAFSYRPSIDFHNLAQDTLRANRTNRGHYYFAPMFKPNADDVMGLNDTIRNVMLDADDIDMLTNYGWSAARGTSYPKAYMLLMEFLIFDDAELNRKRRELFVRLATACGEKGWCEYRTPVAFHNLVQGQYSYNDGSLLRLYEVIKDALDPNGIMAPGRSGIWPKQLRSLAKAPVLDAQLEAAART